ncbi:hypothetical protein CC79DRAFT_1369765 [Sarocladium strictum]
MRPKSFNFGHSVQVLPLIFPISSTTSFAKPTNNPSKDGFVRRANFEAAVVGNFLYFDGGESSQKNTERFTNAVNALLSIDLSYSWEVDNVTIIETTYAPESKQVTIHQALMLDPSGNSFYAWGGATSFNEPINETNFWRFDADGDGGGEWVDVTPNKDDNDDNEFFNIKRSNDASVASTDSAGFVFGGNVMSTTENEADPQGGAGYRVFNFTTKKWAEERVVPYAESNFLMRGSAVFAPNFGPNGLIFLLGGFSDKTDPKSGMDFQTLWFMDPVERKWYSQITSGNFPGSREHPCSLGVATEDGKFDIFMFAGGNLNGLEFSDVYVLSLPGFHWEPAHRGLGPFYQRVGQACAVVGQRQLLSFGGVRTTQGGSPEEYWLEPDPWTQGIGIFDMSSWSWKDRFDADADSYIQHKTLREWYDRGELNNVEWSKDVKALFVSQNESDTGGDLGSDGNDKDLNVGVIAGSIVGGIVLIAAVIGGWLCWRRHHRRKRVAVTAQLIASPPPIEGMQPKTGSHDLPHHQAGYNMSPSEMPSECIPSELDSAGRGPYELGGSNGGNRGI